MDDMTDSNETPEHRQSADESSLSFPAGAHIGRVIGSVALGLLGLLVLLLGADGFIALCGVALVVLFGLVFPILIVKRHQQDHRHELTPEGLELVRSGQSGEETVHQATWSVVDSVTTASLGNRPEAPDFPAVNVAFASGSGRRPKHRSLFSREVLGEKIVLNQPLEIGRWELVELLTAAHERFKPRPKPNSAR